MQEKIISNKEIKSFITENYNQIEKINSEKNEIIFQKEQTKYRLKLPLIITDKNIDKENILTIFQNYNKINYIMILIRAGYSTLGYFKQGKVLKHKTISKYMVRKKQGKAQITYLKKKGKSRYGSRIRLAKTEEFFDEIIEKLNEWKELSFEKIFYSCPVYLWGMIFKFKRKIFFTKKDKRLYKIPFHVRKPIFKELKRINFLINSGLLTI